MAPRRRDSSRPERESDWARIQRDANFPTDVIPAKLKEERVMRREDGWHAGAAVCVYFEKYKEIKCIFV